MTARPFGDGWDGVAGEARTVASGRAALAAYAVGTGEPVVFLHANVCDSRMWRDQLRGVGASARAVAYDRRGFGGTRAEGEAHSPVGDLVAVLDAVAGGRPAVLVGCSQGGKVALDAALRHPGRVRGLVLVAPSVGGAPEPDNPPEAARLLAWQRAVEEAGDPDGVTAAKARLWLDGPLSAEGRVAGPARDLFLDMAGRALRSPPVGASLDAEPAFPRLGGIRAPALLVWGDLDFPHVQARSRRIASLVADGTGHVMAGVAHLPSLERPTDVTALVTGFLARLHAADA